MKTRLRSDNWKRYKWHRRIQYFDIAVLTYEDRTIVWRKNILYTPFTRNNQDENCMWIMLRLARMDGPPAVKLMMLALEDM